MGMILDFVNDLGGVCPCPHTHGDDPESFTSDTPQGSLSPHAWG